MAEKTKTEVIKKDTHKITLPLTDDKQDDVVVIINGMSTVIQRGVEVEVSQAVYEVLKNQETMDMLALKRRRALAGRTVS